MFATGSTRSTCEFRRVRPDTRQTTASADASPSFSPNGLRLIFDSARGGNADIYVDNVDGTGETRPTTDAATDSILPQGKGERP